MSTTIVVGTDPENGGSVAGRLPFGKRIPVQSPFSVAETIVLLAVTKPTLSTRSEKLILGVELTVRTRIMGMEDPGVYVV